MAVVYNMWGFHSSSSQYLGLPLEQQSSGKSHAVRCEGAASPGARASLPSGARESDVWRACRWVIQDALKVATHALLMAYNVLGVRAWGAGKAGVDGRLLGIRVRRVLYAR